jgi:hypothetical protein
METALLASQLLDSLTAGDAKRASTAVRLVDRLLSHAGTFDAAGQERVELLGAVAEGVRIGSSPPAHLELLRHLARTLLIQSAHGAA